jgi:hypothetical protein
MAISVKHAFVTAKPDDPTSDVSADEWNDAHTVTGVQNQDDGLDDIAALAVTDGNFIVGDGANWVAESGATVRTSLGLVAGGAGDIWAEKAGDTMTGDLKRADNVKSIYGTGDDAEIYYDGTNLIIDPAVVGVGKAKVNGAILVSADDDLFSLFGTTSPVLGTADEVDRVVIVKSHTGTSFQAMRALQVVVDFTGSSNSNTLNYGFNAFTYYSGSGNSITTAGGRMGTRLNGGSGTITAAYGISALLDAPASSTATITNYYALYSEGTNITGNTVTNFHGLYVENMTGGTITNAYGGVIVKQTSGTNNYGFWLNGDGIGADVVLGAGRDVSFRYSGTNTELANLVGSGYFDVQMDMHVDAITINDAQDIILNTSTGTKFGTATTQKLAFYNSTPIVQPTALTTQLTSITHTAPGTPDYALQDLIDSGVGSAWGFATQDEGNTLLSVVANLQTRMAEVETKQQALGLFA